MSTDQPRKLESWAPRPAADALSVHAWRRGVGPARAWAERSGIEGSFVLAAAAAMGALAFLMFWFGHFGLGLVAGIVFLMSALASEPRGVLAWIPALIPLFWWWGWSHGLVETGRQLAPVYGLMVLWAAVGGGVADLTVALLFERRFGLSIDAWQRFDSSVALVAAGPSINLAVLATGWIAGRPNAGLVVMAWWTIVTVIVHTVRLAQAGDWRARGKPIAPWRQA